MRMIFVNLPVKDVKASRRFFGQLGFSFNEQFSNDDSTCMVIDENIFAMLLEEARFKSFIVGEIADTSKGVEVLTCLSCDSREEVKALTEKALAAGGQPWKEPQDHGWMFGWSFRDLDGHVWELAWMDPAAAQGQPEAAEATA
jgi:hypothetical protein